MIKRKLINAGLIVATVCMVLAMTGCANSKDPYKDMSAKELYELGKMNAKKKSYAQAIKYFDALEAHYPYGEYTDKGQLALIHALANGGEETMALSAADRFIRMHPRHPHVDFAYYMKGVINYNENYSLAFRVMPLDRSLRSSEFAQQGFDDFKTFLEKFPNSKYAYDARQRMLQLREQLANHNLSIAEYYERQGASLAAANRAAYVVHQFPQTESAPKALFVMQRTYAAMGLHKEAREAVQMLASNYPKYEKVNKPPSALPVESPGETIDPP